MAYTVILDAGHGGEDFGATYNGRKEKDDVLRLVLAVGKILEENCVNVEYTRTTDVYNTPFQKAVIGNNSGADFFVSIHRNAYTTPNTTKGVETLVFNDNGIKAEMARNINSELSRLGFVNRGVIERPNLVVLKRTSMPAVLIEAGFIDSDEDNATFDREFDEIAEAIAKGIIETIGAGCDNDNGRNYYSRNNMNGMMYDTNNNSEINDGEENSNNSRGNTYNNVRRENADNNIDREYTDREYTDNIFNRENLGSNIGQGNTNNNSYRDNINNFANADNSLNNGNTVNRENNGQNSQNSTITRKLYRVQVGAYRNREYADELLNELKDGGYPAFIVMEDGLYKVQSGAYAVLDNAVRMEDRLRRAGYNTFITT